MELHLVSELAKCRVFAVTLTTSAKKWFRAIPTGTISSWQQLSTSFFQHFQATRKSFVPLAHLGNVKKKRKNSEVLHQSFQWDVKLCDMVARHWGTCLSHQWSAPWDLFWDELQQKKFWSVNEFYRKAHKYLKLEDSKEALRKAEWEPANKKNNPRIVPIGSKEQDKRQGEDKRAKSLKKQRSGPVENKGPLPKYTNYHSLNAPLDHIYAVTVRGLYRSPEPTKSERVRRDIKRNCAFHKDIGHATDKCVALKD